MGRKSSDEYRVPNIDTSTPIYPRYIVPISQKNARYLDTISSLSCISRYIARISPSIVQYLIISHDLSRDAHDMSSVFRRKPCVITYRAIYSKIQDTMCTVSYVEVRLVLESRRYGEVRRRASRYYIRYRAISCDTIYRISYRYREVFTGGIGYRIPSSFPP